MHKHYVHALNLACLFFPFSLSSYFAPCLPPTSHVTLKGAGLSLSPPFFSTLCSPDDAQIMSAVDWLSLALKSAFILPFTHILTMITHVGCTKKELHFERAQLFCQFFPFFRLSEPP